MMVEALVADISDTIAVYSIVQIQLIKNEIHIIIVTYNDIVIICILT